MIQIVAWLFVALIAMWMVGEGKGILNDRKEATRYREQDETLRLLRDALNERRRS